MIQFPQDFLWGASLSSYQAEGSNSNADWWHWEKASGKEPSGEACRHYDLFAQDFDLAKSLNHNAHRLSLEWSRIEPSEGEFSHKEIDHYRSVITALIERNIEPVVTLHHFTIPQWLAQKGGWLAKGAEQSYLRYCEKVVSELAPRVRFWVTINEPLVYVYHAYLIAAWPPQEESFTHARKVTDRLVSSHIRAYRLIHRIYKQKNLAAPRVSIAKNMQAFVPCSASLKNRLGVALRSRWFNFRLLDTLVRHKALDYIGVNYYSRKLVDVKAWKFKNIILDECKENHLPLEKNSLGWDIYPEGIYELLSKLKKYKLPVFILENGICTDDDGLRWNFIYDHLVQVGLAMQQGVNVMGYLYWSLIDNFEWDKGFNPRFGLIEVDYRSMRRTVRSSAYKFAAVCKSGVLER
jgi:beta-glucosidase